MGNSYHERLDAEMEKLPLLRGEAILKQIQKIIQLAQDEGDNDTVAEWNGHLIRAGSDLGRFDYQLAGFGGLKKLYESSEKYADLREQLLWYQKWIAEDLPKHLDVSVAQIDAFLTQMEAFYRAEKTSLRPVYEARCRTFAFIGEIAQAKEYYEKWQNEEKGDSDDCPACETHAKVQYLLHVDEPEKALEAAEPIFKGEEQCEEVPATTFSRLLLVAMMHRDIEMAEAMHQTVIRQVRKVPKLLSYLAPHIAYLSMTGRSVFARRLAVVMLARGMDQSRSSYDQMSAWRAGWTWVEFLKIDGQTTVRLPKIVLPGAKGQPVPIDDAIMLMREKAIEFSSAFDRRHGNTQFMDGIATLGRLVEGFKQAREKQDE